MTKRLLSLLLAIILVFSVTGCATSKNDTKPNEETTNTETSTEPSDTTPDDTQTDTTVTEPSDTTTEEDATTPTESTTEQETKPSQDTNKETENTTEKEQEKVNNNKTETEKENTTSSSDRVVVKDEVEVKQSNVGLQVFDSKMISYLEQKYGVKENMFASPLSLKYMLTMAAIGSNGETQKELLQVLGFKSIKECEDWAKSYLEMTKPLDNLITETPPQEDGIIASPGIIGGSDKTTLNIANSVWHNANKGGKIKTTFINAINKACGAEVFNVNGNKLKNEINTWIEKETNGMIKNMVDDSVANKNTVLINALYLKAQWTSKFSKGLTHKDNFKCTKESAGS